MTPFILLSLLAAMCAAGGAWCGALAWVERHLTKTGDI